MKQNGTINVGIYGASGYTGFEAISILRKHPNTRLVFATSENSAGKCIGDIYPVTWDVPLVAAADAPLNKVDAVFCCLPHGASMPTVITAREAGVRVVDLSADFRLADAEVYQQWYKVPHASPELLNQAVYGIPELFRSEIAETDLLASPGCYPTSILLPLAPLFKEKLLDPAAYIIADSKSGVSGAGRKANIATQFVEVNEDLRPYNIGQSHRHVPEMAQTMNQLGGDGEKLIFSPHLVPISRGMLSTIYITLAEDTTAEALHQLLTESYAASPLIHILPLGQLASMAHTRHTNDCVISVTAVSSRQVILCSSIDNLGKGATGQAVQSFNIMFGLDETAGLL